MHRHPSSAHRPRAQSVSGPLAATDIHGETLALARVAACSIQDSLASTDQLVSQVPVPLLHQPFSTLPQPGDVLAANLAATTKFDVSIVPGPMVICGLIRLRQRRVAIWRRTFAWTRGSWRIGQLLSLASHRERRDAGLRTGPATDGAAHWYRINASTLFRELASWTPIASWEK
jgi:hypothetical protein